MCAQCVLYQQLHMSGATEESNEKHLEPWSVACHRDGIVNTPLSPYMDQELLYNKSADIGLGVMGVCQLYSLFTFQAPSCGWSQA